MSTTQTKVAQKLALHGGPRAVTRDPGDIFRWPIVTDDDERAVLEVLRAGAMSGTDVTRQFEAEFARWLGVPFALAGCNGTAALQTAMWAVGVRRGDEVICPAMTYWASGLPALTLGAAVVWADIRADTLCLDPASAADRIGERTKAIVAVHYAGHPAEMDAILALARPRGIRVIEDVSHAHAGVYKGRKLGTIGDVAAMSCMSGKSLAIGEGGMLVTDEREIYERALLWGHYERHGDLTIPELKAVAGLPFGAVKHRLNQVASAMGRVQLRRYDARNAEILKAMHYFWDALEGTPGVKAHRPPPGGGSQMGGWYHARALYDADPLGGLPLARFVEALAAEGYPGGRGANAPLHLLAAVNEVDIYGDGRPTILANATRDTRAARGSLPVSEAVAEFVFAAPWFKHYRPAVIDEYVLAVKKVVAHADQLRE
jgi:perosamine synthetase